MTSAAFPHQQPSPMPSHRYRPYPYAVDLPDRRWPAGTITAPPRWCSVDLRDGNQALREPMSMQHRLRMFDLLVRTGFTEIEIGFPAAVAADHEFLRRLIDDELIPQDVTIQVITGCRERWIEATFRSLRGASRAVVHFFAPTSELQRELVIGADRAGVVGIAVDAALACRGYAAGTDTEVTVEYTMDSWTETEPDFALSICSAVIDALDPSPARPMIVNLPATVEVATPNVYADSVEWMHRNLPRRASIVLSLHPHNDRGTAVAAAELGLLAGADRVEGCLFGNGERTGNVDLVTLALNMLVHGIDPQLDLSDLDEVRHTVEDCTGMPVAERHPYAGNLVHTSMARLHQRAIDIGLDAMAARAAAAGVPVGSYPWRVPYLPIDPRDIGRTYQAVSRSDGITGARNP